MIVNIKCAMRIDNCTSTAVQCNAASQSLKLKLWMQQKDGVSWNAYEIQHSLAWRSINWSPYWRWFSFVWDCIWPDWICEMVALCICYTASCMLSRSITRSNDHMCAAMIFSVALFANIVITIHWLVFYCSAVAKKKVRTAVHCGNTAIQFLAPKRIDKYNTFTTIRERQLT